MVGKSASEKPFAPKNGVYCRQQIRSCIGLDYVTICTQLEGFFHYFARIHRGGVQRAAREFLERQDAVLVVEEQRGENFVVAIAQLRFHVQRSHLKSEVTSQRSEVRS